MTTSVPLWSVARPLRETVEPESLGAEVLHYSIPVLEAIGGPQIEATDTIKSQKLRLRGGELLISKLNPRKSRVLLVPTVTEATVASTEFVAFAPYAADPRFLVYVMLSESTRQLLDANVRSVTRSHQRVEPEIIARAPIPNIPLDEQRRIADFLDTETTRLDKLLSLRGRQLATLPVRWRSCLDETMDALVARFGAAPLGRTLARIEQGTSPQCDNYPAPDDEWGVLKAGAVKGDRFLPDENKHLPDDLAPEARFEVRAGDLLVTRANTPALVGAAAVVPGGVRPKLILCDKIFRLRLTSGTQPQFVALLSQASVIRDARAAAATGASSSMVNLTNQDVKSWPIPAAPADAQRAVIEELMTARESQHRLQSALATQMELVAERRQAIIAAAVTGQLDVTTARGRHS